MITRRRLLTMLAGTAALPFTTGTASAQTRRWHGTALGAKAQIVLDHPDAKKLISLVVNEIERLEQIFSLYRSNSQLSVLNREGVLENPSFEMIELLSICSTLHARTNGAFDPTIQPIWSLYAEKYSAGRKPGKGEIARTMERVGWQYVNFSANSINFGRKGAALTLNGIAQGYIADRVSRLLRNNGVRNVLVNTGEIMGNGVAPDGQAWPVKLAGKLGEQAFLENAAIATSAPLGTAFDGEKTVGHIIDPRTGAPSGKWPSISVMAPSAAVADGLSTAFCLMAKSRIMATVNGEKVWLG